MMRKMVGKRPSVVIAIGTKGPHDEGGESQSDESGESSDEQNQESEAGTETDVHSVRCKVCNTDIDTTTGEPVEDKHNEMDSTQKKLEHDDNMGKEVVSNEGVPPSKEGTAFDASHGELAITKALNILGGRK